MNNFESAKILCGGSRIIRNVSNVDAAKLQKQKFGPLLNPKWHPGGGMGSETDFTIREGPNETPKIDKRISKKRHSRKSRKTKNQTCIKISFLVALSRDVHPGDAPRRYNCGDKKVLF